MKILFFIFSITFILSCSNSGKDIPESPVSQDTLTTGWRRVVFPISSSIVDIAFPDNNNGYALTGNGLYKSTDGGNTWSLLNSLYSGGNISCGNINTFTTVDQTLQSIASTKNGGNTFNTSRLDDIYISDVFYVNNNTAYLAGRKFYKTTNGGDSWQKLDSFQTAINNYSTLFFLDSLQGWVLFADEYIYKTTNGGLNWTKISIQNSNARFHVGSIYFVSSSTGFYTDVTAVYKTTDGGTTWNKVFTIKDGGYNDLHFVNATTGYVNDSKHIYKTTDGGATWTTVASVKEGSSIIEIHFTDANHGWACGEGGTLLKFE